MKWRLLEYFPIIFWAMMALTLIIVAGCGDGTFATTNENHTTVNTTTEINDSEDVVIGDSNEGSNTDTATASSCGYLETSQEHGSALDVRCEGPSDVISTATCSDDTTETTAIMCSGDWVTVDPLCGASTIQVASEACPELTGTGTTDS
jgi:hypothetical protein